MSSTPDTSTQCVYTPLSAVDWKGEVIYPTCGSARWTATNPILYFLFGFFHGMTYWMALRLSLRVLMTFKSWRSIYFWSIVITNLGIIVITIAYDLTRFTFLNVDTGTWIQIVGWMLMVIGFVLVLYSRLYLVIIYPRVRRILLPVILLVTIGTNVLTYTLIFVSTGLELENSFHNLVYTLAWRLQLLSPIEEIVLASFYVFFFIHFLKSSVEDSRLKKNTFYLLCIAQAIIVICDVGVVVMTYRRLILLRTIVYPFVYALKLEFEFLVLNRLIHFTTRRNEDVNSFIDIKSSEAMKAQSTMPILGLETGRVRNTDLKDGVANLSVAETLSALSSTCSGDTTDIIRQVQKNSMEEMERKYLGQYRAENPS